MWVLAAVILFAAGLYLGRLTEEEEEPTVVPALGDAVEPLQIEDEVIAEPVEEEVPELQSERPVRVALVIDDLGRSLAEVERLEALGVAISYSVLPFEVLTEKVVAALRERDREYLCHLPMEPSNNANPGPGALLSSMRPAEIEEATRRALDAVAGAVGVNNHMGSGLSTDADAMATVGRVLAGRDLFFLDSRTTAESVAYEVIRELGVPSAERQVFLDPDLGEQAIREQFLRLLQLAREQGSAIAIGHPHPMTFAVLEREVPIALAEGVEFVPVSYLLERSSGPS